MSAPVATSTGYLERLAPIQEIISDPGREEPHVPVVHMPSTPRPVQKYPIEAVVEIISLTSARSVKQGEVELEAGSARGVPVPTDTQTPAASDEEDIL